MIPLDQRQVLLSSPGQVPQHPEQLEHWTRRKPLPSIHGYQGSFGRSPLPRSLLDSTPFLVVGGELGEGVWGGLWRIGKGQYGDGAGGL